MTKEHRKFVRTESCCFQLAAQQGARAINNDNGSENLYIKYIYFIVAEDALKLSISNW